jgi:hypothetical protein
MLKALLNPYRVTVIGYRDDVIVHRAKSFYEALSWAACYPAGVRATVSTRFGRALAVRF